MEVRIPSAPTEHFRDMNPRRDEAICFTIYNSPSDFPGRFVVRPHLLKPVRGAVLRHALAGSLEEARGLIPDRMVLLGRLPDDDPAIVETWM